MKEVGVRHRLRGPGGEHAFPTVSVRGASNGAFSTGVLPGLCFGIVFTILPLGLLWFTMRRPMGRRTSALWLLLALILATPNLMTLGVAVGTLIAVLIFVVLVIAYQRKGRTPRAPR